MLSHISQTIIFPSAVTLKLKLAASIGANPLYHNQWHECFAQVQMSNKSHFLSEGVLSVSWIYALHFISILLAKHHSESFLKYLPSPASCFSVFTKIAFSTYWQKSLIPHKPKMGMLRKTLARLWSCDHNRASCSDPQLPLMEANPSPGTALQGEAEWEGKSIIWIFTTVAFPEFEPGWGLELVRECQVKRKIGTHM